MADEPDDNASSPAEEYMSGENTHHEQLQQIAKKEPKPSSITLEEAKKALFRNAPINKLMEKFQEQVEAERQAEREAEARAAEAIRLSRDDSDDEEEFDEEEQSTIQPMSSPLRRVANTVTSSNSHKRRKLCRMCRW